MQNMSLIFCDHCNKETRLIPVYRAIKIAGVSRSTIYYWFEKDWVHWVTLPSGRKLICEESLLRKRPEPLKLLAKGAAA